MTLYRYKLNPLSQKANFARYSKLPLSVTRPCSIGASEPTALYPSALYPCFPNTLGNSTAAGLLNHQRDELRTIDPFGHGVAKASKPGNEEESLYRHLKYGTLSCSLME